MDDKARKVSRGHQVGVSYCTEFFASLCNFILSLSKKAFTVVNVLVLVATFHADKCKCNYHKP